MHQPVLLKETVSNLITNPHGIYVDCTVGGGGHLAYLIKNLADDARVIGLDKDASTLKNTGKYFDYPNITLIQSDFRRLLDILNQQEIDRVDGIMMDLGVSSFQLDIAERGFSYHEDAPLDMRMDRNQSLKAWDIINYYDEKDIKDILWKYGEERYASRIARAIAYHRSQKTIDSTLDLVEIIKSAVPAKYCRDKHPARKSFQALRIAVNSELDALQEVLPQTLQALHSGGRLCVISFHSLEDRIVKNFFIENARECICAPGLPVCVCNHTAQLALVNKKPIIPEEEECKSNPRARSAKLRVASRI